MGEKRRDGDSSSKKEKKSKRDADGAEDAAARAERKAAKRAKKDGGGGDGAADDGSVARVRVSGIPPGADAAKIAKFLGVDASKVVVLSGEATAIMPDAAAAKRAAADLDETKFAGRFVRVARDDFRPEDVATAPPARDAAADDAADDDAPVDRDRRDGGRGEVVEVECAGQTGRIIGKGGSKIREIEQLTGCVLRIRQEEGICEVTGRDVKAAVQEIKNIVEEGRERDGGGARDGFGARNFGAKTDFGDDGRASGFPGFPGVSGFDPNRHAPSTARPFGMPPPGSASRNDTGANDWTCACGSVNFARRASCFRCAAPRDAARSEEFRGEAPASRRSIPSVPSVPSVPDTAATKAPTQGNDGDGYEVFVKYLPHSSEERDVAEFFSQFGPLRGDVRLLRHPATGQCKGAGFVTFAAEHSRDAALAKDGVKFGGRHLSITVAKTGTFGVRGTDQAAGTHTPAMLSETIRALVAPDPNGTYVDGTFGRGGHTRGILSALGPKGRLHAFDMDPEAIAEAKKLEDEDSRFTIHHSPFGCMDTVLGPLGVRPSGVFLDLGISSPQFDDASRGFRPEQDGPLDLRFDVTRGEPASAFLLRVDRDELVRIIEEYGETTDPIAARRVADAVVLAREERTLPSTTKAFAALVAAAKGKEYQAMHPAKLTFQALRIHLNQEFDEMRRGMRAAAEVMRDGGRLGVLTWKHSECAILVDFYRQFEAARADAPLARWLSENNPEASSAASKPSDWALEMDDAQRPSEREMRENSRSRSAILHVLRRRDATARTVDVERAAYPLRGWGSVPNPPEPPPVTFEYEEANARGGEEKKEKREKKEKKDKKEKKRGSKWAEA